MTPWLHWLEFAAAAIALLALDPVGRRVIAAVHVRQKWRERLLRLLPVVEIGAWAAFGIWGATLLFANRDVSALVPAVAVTVVLLWGAWFAVRDVIGGAILRAEDVYEAGDWLRVGAIEGRIRRVGLRSIELEAEDGKRLRVPYSRLAPAAITRAEPTGSSTAHSFQVTVPRADSVAHTKIRLRRAALRSMWSSVTREPQVELSSHTPDAMTFELTVYALHPDYDLEVENAVRATLASDLSAMAASGSVVGRG